MDGYCPLPHRLLLSPQFLKMPDGQRLPFLIMLAGVNRKTGKSYWTPRRIAATANVSLCTIKRLVAYCKKAGLATRKVVWSKGRQRWAWVLSPRLAAAMRGQELPPPTQTAPGGPHKIEGISRDPGEGPTGYLQRPYVHSTYPPPLAVPEQAPPIPANEESPGRPMGPIGRDTTISLSHVWCCGYHTLIGQPCPRCGQVSHGGGMGHVRLCGGAESRPDYRVPPGYTVAVGPDGYVPDNLIALYARAPSIPVKPGGVEIVFQEDGGLTVCDDSGGYVLVKEEL